MIRRVHAIPAATLLAAVAFVACGGDDDNPSTGSGGTSSSSSTGTSSGGGGGAGGCGDACGPVTGSAIDSWIGETGAVDVPADLSAATIEALLPTEGGAWQTIAGSVHADGTFTIPSVPDAPYVLRVDFGGGVPTYVVTSAREVDLGTEVAGRPDAVAPAIDPTDVVANITDLDPWKGTDDIELFVANTNTWTTRLFASSPPQNPPSAGDTALNALTFNWTEAYGAALIDNTKGDTLTLEQISTQTGADNILYSVVTRFVSFSDIAQVDGVSITKDGAFTSVPQDQSASLDLRPTQFADLVAAVNPSATDFDFGVFIGTLPGAGMYGGYGNSADLFVVDLGDGSPDLDLGTVAYGNPYPAAWGAVLYAINTVRMLYTAPGASTPTLRFGTIMVVGDVASMTAGPIQPAISPVQDLKVNGMSAFSDLTGVTTTPTLSWTAPEIGEPTYYNVQIGVLTNNNGMTKAAPIANLFTKDTSLALPPGILATGGSYFVRVRATASPIDVGVHPFRQAVAAARSDAFSNKFAP